MTGWRTIARVAAATAMAAGLVALAPGEPPAVAADGDITTFVDPDGHLAAPQDITAGPDGNLWFTASQTRIGRITPTGTITTFTDPENEVDNPAGITAGPDGNLWFTSLANDRIGRIDPDDGTITTFTDPLNNVDGPIAITSGPDGNLWFVDALNARVGRITTAGTITTFLVAS